MIHSHKNKRFLCRSIYLERDMNQIRKKYTNYSSFIIPSHKILETHTYNHMLHVSDHISNLTSPKKKNTTHPSPFQTLDTSVSFTRYNFNKQHPSSTRHRSTPISTRIYRRANPSERKKPRPRKERKNKKKKKKNLTVEEERST